jgi:hypothetical protein
MMGFTMVAKNSIAAGASMKNEVVCKGLMEAYVMRVEICQCCAAKMNIPSPRNPNICLSCEQLLEDDCAELNRVLPGVKRLLITPRREAPQGSATDDGPEYFLTPADE